MIQPITISNGKRLDKSNFYTPRNETSITNYFKEINNKKYDSNLTKDDEKKLFEEIKNGDENAKTKLINANLRFVISVAKHYLNQGLAFEDLVNEGNIGLLKAIDKFEPERNIKFISFSVWWIRQAIMIAIINTGKTIRIPTNKKEHLSKINKVISKLEKELERKPSIDEILNISENLSAKKLLKIQTSNLTQISFDTPINNNKGDEDGSLYDLIAAEETSTVSRQDELANEIKNMLKILPEKERVILEMYFGLFCEKKSLDEIGELFNRSRERVRQQKDTAILRLRNHPDIKKLIEYLAI